MQDRIVKYEGNGLVGSGKVFQMRSIGMDADVL